MKTYLNPQPYAVDRINKTHNEFSDLEHMGSKQNEVKPISEKTTTEIFETESEELAWKDALEKKSIE